MFDMCVKLFYFMDILSDVKVAGNLTTDGNLTTGGNLTMGGNIDTNGYVVARSITGVGGSGVYAKLFSVVKDFDYNGEFRPLTEIFIGPYEIRANNARASFSSVSTCSISLDSVSITRFTDLKTILGIIDSQKIPRTTEIKVTVPENCTKFHFYTDRVTEFPIVNVWNMCSGKLVQMDLCYEMSTGALYAEMATGFSSSTNLKFMINEV